MANVGNAHYEYDGGNTRGDDDGPDGPLVTAAGIGNSVKRYGDAALDEDCARGVEEFGDEKVLLLRISFIISNSYRGGREHKPWFLA
jgi:hypothetical protein